MKKSMAKLVWVLEAEAFSDSHAIMSEGVKNSGGDWIPWRDDWLKDGTFPNLAESAVVFHGSLGNAAYIQEYLPWKPGAFCDTRRFLCSSWYPVAKEWLLHRDWALLSAKELVANPGAIVQAFGSPASVFVRPDSPLKPFSGRIVPLASLSLASLDFGFYFNDPELPVIVAPVRNVVREWRYVIVQGRVIAGSAYDPGQRAALPDSPNGKAWQFAAHIAKNMPPPESVYVLDLCEADNQLHLLEINPFSGADLYACDRPAVVRAVSDLAIQMLMGTP